MDFSIFSTWPDDLTNEGKPIDAAVRIRNGPADPVIAAWISKYRQQPRRAATDKSRNDPTPPGVPQRRNISSAR
ncbi:MAG: hypothetical protein JSR30_14285 [Proteobacteria bacterium]|nr:hypothetical protein [Pseudomonadota bacterium]